MFVSPFQFILAWVMTALLLFNSVLIMVNIFDFPPTGIRSVILFAAALGFVAAVMFLIIGVFRLLGFAKRF